MLFSVKQMTTVVLWVQIVPHRVAARLLADQGLMKLLLNIATWILDPQGAGESDIPHPRLALEYSSHHMVKEEPGSRPTCSQFVAMSVCF